MQNPLSLSIYLYIYIYIYRAFDWIRNPVQNRVPNPIKICAQGLVELGTGLKCLAFEEGGWFHPELLDFLEFLQFWALFFWNEIFAFGLFGFSAVSSVFFKTLPEPGFFFGMRSFLFVFGLRGGGVVSPRTVGFFGFFGISAVLSIFFWIGFLFFGFFGISAVSSLFSKP